MKYDLNKFEQAARHLMEYLRDHHPHTSVIVTAGNAELVEGVLNITDLSKANRQIDILEDDLAGEDLRALIKSAKADHFASVGKMVGTDHIAASGKLIDPVTERQVFKFKRYFEGCQKAEGCQIEKEKTLGAAYARAYQLFEGEGATVWNTRFELEQHHTASPVTDAARQEALAAVDLAMAVYWTKEKLHEALARSEFAESVELPIEQYKELLEICLTYSKPLG